MHCVKGAEFDRPEVDRPDVFDHIRRQFGAEIRHFLRQRVRHPIERIGHGDVKHVVVKFRRTDPCGIAQYPAGMAQIGLGRLIRAHRCQGMQGKQFGRGDAEGRWQNQIAGACHQFRTDPFARRVRRKSIGHAGGQIGGQALKHRHVKAGGRQERKETLEFAAFDLFLKIAHRLPLGGFAVDVADECIPRPDERMTVRRELAPVPGHRDPAGTICAAVATGQEF